MVGAVLEVVGRAVAVAPGGGAVGADTGRSVAPILERIKNRGAMSIICVVRSGRRAALGHSDGVGVRAGPSVIVCAMIVARAPEAA